ncbi:MAG: CopG family transcriptional regulator [Pseudonocardiaceae bacterium]|nr:CopG family transcriptional regulator [Pseudonocardiaceae bacterium]
MRTTINLPDGLVAHAKEHAASSGRTFTSLVEEGLRVLLEQQRHEADAQPEPLPAYGDPSGRVLIDLADREAVWAVLDEGPQR